MTSSRASRPDTGRPGPLAGPDRRAEFRAFVRDHHPDVGGDPEIFRDGLRAFREGRSPTSPPAPGSHLLADDPRLDGPITAVRGGALPRIGRLGRRLIRRYDPRPGSARVV